MSNLNEYQKYQDQVKAKSQELQKEQAHSILKQIIAKRLQTSFIFSISELERIFGHLWRHEADDENFSEQEEFYYNLYQEFRKSVLDNGNKQIRNTCKDIDGYEVSFKRINFPVQNKDLGR